MVVQLLNKFAAFYETRRMINVFTRDPIRPYSETDKFSPHSHTFALRFLLL
jgi:hypothetical protein